MFDQLLDIVNTADMCSYVFASLLSLSLLIFEAWDSEIS